MVIHDANGNLTALGTNSYRYNFENRLLSYSLGETFSGKYLYDGLGNRLCHTTNGAGRRFVFDRLGTLTQVIAEADEQGNLRAYYVYGHGLAERISTDNRTSTYHFDLRGSTVLLTSETGEEEAAYAYDTAGVLADSDAENPQPFRYLGQHGIMDDSNGLYHARARYFSPLLGRFISQDPLWGEDSSSQTFNRYVYALNNPLTFVDINGLSAQETRIAQYKAEAAQYATEAAYWNAYYDSASWMVPYLKAAEVAGQVAGWITDILTLGESAVVRNATRRILLEGAERLAILESKAIAHSTAKATIGATGKVGEDVLKMLGGESQVFLPTSQGGRYVDQFVNGIAHESKVGYQSLTTRIRAQIAKDIELIQTKQIQGATWHFFKSPVTGLLGPSQPLLDALEKASIKVLIH